MVAAILTSMSGMFSPDGSGNGGGDDYTRTPPPLQKIVDWFHGRASTNRREDIHHTLGYGPGQAAPGEDVRSFFLGQGVPGYGQDLGGSTPPGTVVDGFWTSAPSGYLMLDGSVVNRDQYSALFSILGTTYNTGGETGAQFRLPDARGRVLVQLDTTAEFDVLGETGGAKTHTLTLAESPMHWHSVGFDAGNNGTIDAYLVQETSSTPFPGYAMSLAGSSGGLRRGVTDRQGGGGAHNNLQPYIVVNRAIKY